MPVIPLTYIMSPRQQSVVSDEHRLPSVDRRRARDPTDLWVSPGFMLFMLGCMGTFPCGSFCLFFWWRSRRRRPSSSHHDDSRAARRTHTDTGYVHSFASPHTHTHTHTCRNTNACVRFYVCIITWGEGEGGLVSQEQCNESHACFQTLPAGGRPTQ